MRHLTILAAALLLTGCLLTKEQRQNRRANKKLDKLIDKYPQLLEEDTLRDTVTVTIEEIRIDTVVQMSQDVTGVDSILENFSHKLDSVTALQLGNDIKYYITKREVIEDTIVHQEDGVTVKLWQEGGVIQISVFKPQEEIKEEVVIPYEKVRPADETPKLTDTLQRLLFWLVLFILVYLVYRALKKTMDKLKI